MALLDWLYENSTLPVGDWLRRIPSGQQEGQTFNLPQSFQVPPLLTAPRTAPEPGPLQDRGFPLPMFPPQQAPQPPEPGPLGMPRPAPAPNEMNTPFGPLSPESYKELNPNSAPVPPPFPKQPPMNADAAMRMPMGVFDPRNKLPGMPTEKVGASPGATDINHYQAAISAIESGSPEGNYTAVGPSNKKGQRAYGRYQVMDFNIGPWTKEVLGREMTPDEFLKSPEAQDAVFKAKFSDYVRKAGNPQDAAAMWFSGRPLAASANDRDVTGTSVKDYVAKFNANLGSPARNIAPVAAGAPPATPPGAPPPSAMPSAPSDVEDLPIAIDRRINFGKNANIWQALASIGGGMMNQPRYLGFAGALGEGLKAGTKTLQEFPMKQLGQALGETQLTSLQSQAAARRSLLSSLPNIKDPTARMAMIAALNDNSGRTMAALFAPNSPVRLNPEKGGWEVNRDVVSADAAKKSSETDISEASKALAEAPVSMKAATDSLSVIKQIREVLPFVKTGVNQENITQWGGILSRLGLGDDAKQVPAEVLRKLLEQLKVKYVRENFPQRVTNIDLVTGEIANANQNMRPEAIERALNVTEHESQKTIDYYTRMSQYARDNGMRLNPEGRPSFTEDWRSHYEKNWAPKAPSVVKMPVEKAPDNVLKRDKNGRTEYWSAKYNSYVYKDGDNWRLAPR